MTFEPALEHQLLSTLKQEAETISLALPTELTMEISRRTAQAWKRAMDGGKDNAVLLCDSRIRAPLAEMLCRTVPTLKVVAYDEIVLGTDVESTETISIGQTAAAQANEPQLAAAVT